MDMCSAQICGCVPIRLPPAPPSRRSLPRVLRERRPELGADGAYQGAGLRWDDAATGDAYLKELAALHLARHLDYWAIADIHSIKRQIHSHGGMPNWLRRTFDVKLGRGGVSEIEFFAQVQQLILGGRRPELRAPKTKDGA
jgi:glutamine synthetase adenylyltransferase